MQRLTRVELERLIALQSNKYRKDVALVLDAYYSVLRDAILLGYRIDVPGIGSYSNSQMNAKEERIGKMPKTGEEIVIPAHDAYNKPIFRFKDSIRNEMKEATEGKVF
jgi:nucleoid DNA-binding protein